MERQFFEPRRQDPYRTKTKPQGYSRCPSCESVNIKGRWIAAEAAGPVPARVRSNTELCPACRQARDRYAMGVIELHGLKWNQKSELVFQTIGRTEEIARRRNDQERILWSQTSRGVTKIYVTLPELARRIGRELEKSFKGEAEYHTSTEEPYVRVIWKSDGKDRRPSPTPKNKSRAWRARSRARTRTRTR